MIDFRKTKFVKSCPTKATAPDEKLPEIIFIGKSNVGKSSLINAICENKSLAFTSSKPGHTRLLNYFLVDNKCYFVDAPGYGYSSAGHSHTVLFGDMMEDYFSTNEHISVIVYLLDSRRVPSNDDIEFYQFLKENNLPYIIAVTKCDKLNQSEKAAIYRNMKVAFEDLAKERIILTSATDQRLLNDIRKTLASYIEK